MKKSYRNMQKRQMGKQERSARAGQRWNFPCLVAGVIGSLPEVIREMAQEAGLLLMSAAMDSECEMIAESKNAKNPLRAANWWGSDLSPVYYDRQKVLIERPRLRG